MKAIVVRELGGPEQLLFEDVPEPEPGPDQLLVEVAAAGVNFIDIYQRSGLYAMNLPFTPGLEGAGRVVAVGDEVASFSPGDRVGWVSALGTYSERHLVSAHNAIPLPEGIDDDVAAALLLQGITAHYLATDTFPLSAGDICLIHAGAGGVGLLLTQIAKGRGAEVVTTVGSQEKAALSEEAGADVVVVYTETDFKEAIEKEFGANSIDVVYDGVGATTFERGLDVLRPRGMMVSFGNASGPPPEISPLILSRKGSLFLTRPTMAHYTQTKDELMGRVSSLFDLVRAGMLTVRIGERFPLADAADAHRALQGRGTTGKVLLEP